MSGGGFFVTARRMFEHEMFAGDAYSRRDAWLWLIAQAAWRDGPELKRGQLAFSQRSMARLFGWTDNKVRWFLKGLQQRHMVEIHNAGHNAGHNTPPSIITICNYNKYQSLKKTNNTGHNTGHNALEKEENQLNQSKKENIRRVEADHDHFFEEFWKAFPKREGDNPKAKAHTKFLQLAKAGTNPSSLIAAAHSYARLKHNTERKFIPQAITWLNQRRWEDGTASQPEDEPWSDEERERRFAELRRKA